MTFRKRKKSGPTNDCTYGIPVTLCRVASTLWVLHAETQHSGGDWDSNREVRDSSDLFEGKKGDAWLVYTHIHHTDIFLVPKNARPFSQCQYLDFLRRATNVEIDLRDKGSSVFSVFFDILF